MEEAVDDSLNVELVVLAKLLVFQVTGAGGNVTDVCLEKGSCMMKVPDPVRIDFGIGGLINECATITIAITDYSSPYGEHHEFRSLCQPT